MLKALLAHPLTRGRDLDDPETTSLRRRIVQEKALLRRVYLDWYRQLCDALPVERDKPVLELGSGGGFLKALLPDLITSDVFACDGVERVVDAHELPFEDDSLSGVVMTNVFHHLPRPRRFLAEAARCVAGGGAVAMVEPWISTWSKLVYRHLHHEPFDVDAAEWEFPATGPLSGANGALPYIVFVRDRAKFALEFPQWRVETVRPMMSLRYLVSGGVSLRSLMPGWTYGFWRGVDAALNAAPRQTAMFALIVLRRTARENEGQR